MWTKLFAAVLFLTALGGAGATTRPSASSPPPHVLYPPTSESEAKLKEMIPSLRLKNVPLPEAIEKLREMSHANFFVNWRALEAAGVARDVPVDVDLQNVSLAAALKWVTKSASAGASGVTFTLRDNVIYVSTDDDVASQMELRVYDVRDLIEGERALRGPGLDERDPSDRSPAAQERVELTDELLKLVTDTVAPQSWRDSGGAASINVFYGRLFIRQTWENHQLVEAALTLLRDPGAHGQSPATSTTAGVDPKTVPTTRPTSKQTP